MQVWPCAISEARRRLEAIGGVRVELLPNHVFPSSLALWLAACLPVPLVKDLVYLRLLFVYGGVALDLDLLSLGKRLPKTGSRQGFTAWTCQEVNRPAGRLFHRTEPLVNFGAIGSEPALTWMGNLEQRLRRHWVSWVVGVMRGEQQEPDWATWASCGRVVMYNQRELTKAFSAAQPGMQVFYSNLYTGKHGDLALTFPACFGTSVLAVCVATRNWPPMRRSAKNT